jgi:integrase
MRQRFRKQIAYLREVMGIDHISPHVFRHLAVTELLEQGAPEQTVIALADWVGHKTIATYMHIDPGHQRAARGVDYDSARRRSDSGARNLGNLIARDQHIHAVGEMVCAPVK